MMKHYIARHAAVGYSFSTTAGLEHPCMLPLYATKHAAKMYQETVRSKGIEQAIAGDCNRRNQFK